MRIEEVSQNECRVVWLDNARSIAVFAVVLLHVAAVFVNENDVGTNHWWVANCYDSLVRWCVPVLVMISGAALLDSKRHQSPTIFYLRRLSRIFVPFLFWSLFFALWREMKSILKGDVFDPSVPLRYIVSGVTYYHLWFLLMLLPLYGLTPVLRKCVARANRRQMLVLVYSSLAIASVASFFLQAYYPGHRLFGVNYLLYVPYFLFGCVVKNQGTPYRSIMLAFGFLISAAFTAIGYYSISLGLGRRAGLYFYDYLSITVIPMSLCAIYLLRKMNKPFGPAMYAKRVSALSMGIYLIHPAVMEIVNLFSPVALRMFPFFAIPAVATLVFLISMVLAWGIRCIPYLKRVV